MYPPQGNQPPSNMPPYGAPPTGYIPQNQRQPAKGGCWLWGGVGCLVLILLIVAGIGIGLYQLKNSKSGKSMIGAIAGAVDSGTKLQLVRKALMKYKAENGSYPASLTDLVPKYLRNASSLHTDSDPNTDPTHISFNYSQPAADASGDTPLVSVDIITSIDIGGGNTKTDDKMTYLINGKLEQDQTTTQTTPDGKTTTTSSHSESGGT